MTHKLHGGNDNGNNNGFTALGKTIGTRKSTPKDSEYVDEYSVESVLNFESQGDSISAARQGLRTLLQVSQGDSESGTLARGT